jgi:hypothetical protein
MMVMRRTVAAALLTLAACGHRGASTAPDMAFVPAFAAHDKVDLLFVLADFTIAPKRSELLQRFPRLIQALDAAAPASYHIGVISTDLGAGPFTYNGGQCHPGGDGAKLQVTPPPTEPAPAACGSFSLAGGVRYIDYDRIARTDNLVGVPDVPTAFTCMASINDGGCPYFQALEAAHLAVSNPPTENAGFLREDALLVIVFLQDTDDCSAPDDSPVFDRSSDPAEAGWYTPTRCANASIACGDPPNPIDLSAAGGPFDDCVARTQADGSQLYDVQRYLDFFTRPGGAKPDPSDVILGSIAPPASPFAWTITQACGPNMPCPLLVTPCSPPIGGGAEPAVRLDAVVPPLGSMCNTDYSAAIDNLAQQIIARLP